MLSVQQLLDQKPKGIYLGRPDDPVLAAIKKMAEHHIGALLVMTRRQARRHHLRARLRAQSRVVRPLVRRDAGRGHHDLQGHHRHRRSRTRTTACAS